VLFTIPADPLSGVITDPRPALSAPAVLMERWTRLWARPSCRCYLVGAPTFPQEVRHPPSAAERAARWLCLHGNTAFRQVTGSGAARRRWATPRALQPSELHHRDDGGDGLRVRVVGRGRRSTR
jgi:hypothetical protein